MLLIEEATRRRPDFAGGETIELANRNRWHFPEVEVVLQTRIGSDGPVPVPIFVVGSGPIDPAFEDALQAAHEAFMLSRPGSTGQQPMIDLATILLRRNYDLTIQECDWLVYRGFWETARRDGRAFSRGAEAWPNIIRIGFTEPLDRTSRLTAGLPRHQGQRFDVGAN